MVGMPKKGFESDFCEFTVFTFFVRFGLLKPIKNTLKVVQEVLLEVLEVVLEVLQLLLELLSLL